MSVSKVSVFFVLVSASLLSYSSADPSSPPLTQHDREWLEEVEPLATPRERNVFLGLRDESERDEFIAGFWEARDPFPQTARNELREQWEDRFQEARRRWGGLTDDRARLFLLQGNPTTSFAADCPGAGSYEVWVYEPRFREKIRTVLVFLRGGAGTPARLWRPGVPGFDPAAKTAACANGEALARETRWIRWAGQEGYQGLIERALARPRYREWISAFAPISLSPSAGAPAFAAGLFVDFTGRQQDKVVMRVLLSVPPGALPPEAGDGGHEFLLAGRVARSGQPFETFLYRFRARPQDERQDREGEPIPLTFERYLPPGTYMLDIKLEHVPSRSVFRSSREITVPELMRADAAPAQPPPAVPAVARTAQPGEVSAGPATPPVRPEVARLFAEADAALEARSPSLRLVAPPGGLLSGLVRFEARADHEIERVAFALDGKPLLTRNKPPYEVRIDLGPVPRPRKLAAEGLSASGAVLARDEMVVNAGVQPVRVRLVEPRTGKTYRNSLRAVAEVEAPAGARVQRVEIYLGDDRVATLYQPPWTQPVLLPKEKAVEYVRAVATLASGETAEDLVLVNAPAPPDAIDVRLVELYATIVDGKGRPLSSGAGQGIGLDGGAFQVVEDGVPQTIRRVDPVQETPLRLVTLLDSSGSMAGRMAATRQTALEFLRSTLRPRDEAALITFNATPRVAVPLTGDLAALEDGLAGLTAEDETALWDSVIYSFFYLSGTKGQRAVLVLSDGLDRTSRFSFEQVVECAQRAGVAVYAIGLALDEGPKGPAAQRLARLAAVTGGRAFFAAGTAELAGVYAQIEHELRSQWRIAYQSTNTKTDGGFRSVQVKVAKSGLEARTISGYYP